MKDGLENSLRRLLILSKAFVDLSMAKSLFPSAPISFAPVKTLLLQDLLYQMNELQNKTKQTESRKQFVMWENKLLYGQTCLTTDANRAASYVAYFYIGNNHLQDSVYMLFRPYNEDVSADIQTMFCKISWIKHSLGQYTLNRFNCENFRDNFQYILKYL